METNKKSISDYYDKSQFFYNLFWPKSGMHYGLWNKGTKNLKEAVENQNKVVCDVLDLQKTDRVLDAGCGIGAVSEFAVKNYGCDVVGITLSKVQLSQANKRLLNTSLKRKLKFLIMDYTDTGFERGSFSKILAIESICHADKKIDFIKEAFRLLKPGGKIAVSDAFIKRSKLNLEEEELYKKFLHALALPNIANKNNFENEMKKTGFKKIKFYDKLEEVRRSSDLMHKYASRSLPFITVLRRLKIVPEVLYQNNVAGVVQKLLADKGVFVYGIFTGEK
ncbi:MAG: class I SAM-dependent methyltransferase [Candidatus Aenigmarchaeota archaeon]|nr:class I SAM-dependent methyltransferase [Candidatus Aenigmarchaeota archaeon]